MHRNLFLPYPFFHPDDPPAGDDPPQDPPQDPPAGDDPPQDPPQDPPGPVPYDRFQEVNRARKKAEADLAKLREDEKKRREKELAEQNKWKELAEEREQELATERRRNLRLQVASQKGIPPDLFDRLQGETQAEMEADADRLLKFLKPSSGPGVPPPPRGGQPDKLELKGMSPEEIRKKQDDILKQVQNQQ